MNSFGKRQRAKRKRWDAKTEVRRFERRKPTWNDTLPLPFGGGRGRGRSRGLSFVSGGEALGGGFMVGSRTGAGIVMTSPARTQMPPARRTQVGRSPPDPIAAAAGSDRHAGRGATTCSVSRDTSAWPGVGQWGQIKVPRGLPAHLGPKTTALGASRPRRKRQRANPLSTSRLTKTRRATSASGPGPSQPLASGEE